MGLELKSVSVRDAGDYGVKPRIDMVLFAGTIPKDEMLTPQIVEYTYTGEETKNRFPLTWTGKVAKWHMETSNIPSCIHEILEENGNYVKFQVKLLDESAWGPIVTDSNTMNLRIILLAEMETVDRKPLDMYVRGKTSKAYHVNTCKYFGKIKEKIYFGVNNIPEGLRPCKVCIKE